MPGMKKPLSHRLFEKLAQLPQRPRIEHIFFFQPAAPGLADAETQIVKIRRAVGIRVDGDQNTLIFGKLAVNIDQVKALGAGI